MCGRHSLPMARHLPGQTHPPHGQTHTPGQTPPGRHPPWADTPPCPVHAWIHPLPSECWDTPLCPVHDGIHLPPRPTPWPLQWMVQILLKCILVEHVLGWGCLYNEVWRWGSLYDKVQSGPCVVSSNASWSHGNPHTS